MDIELILQKRSNSSCELCKDSNKLTVYKVSPSDGSAEQSVYLCEECKTKLDNLSSINENYFKFLSETMWSEHKAVQVLTYRLFKFFKQHDQADMIYFEEDEKVWADAESFTIQDQVIMHKDSNGLILEAGDSVTLIKDLDVKGAGFTAKRGTIVKNIRLTDDPKFIEGKINGTLIVLVASFLKKSL